MNDKNKGHCEEQSDEAIVRLSVRLSSRRRLTTKSQGHGLLRGVYTEHIRFAQCKLRECARNDNFLIAFTIVYAGIKPVDMKGC